MAPWTRGIQRTIPAREIAGKIAGHDRAAPGGKERRLVCGIVRTTHGERTTGGRQGRHWGMGNAARCLWRSTEWNGLQPAFQNATLALLSLVLIHMPSP